MVIADGAVFEYFVALLCKSEYLDTLIHAVLEYLFHIVMVGLTHIYCVQLRDIAKCLDIVVSSAAEVHCAAVESVKKHTVVGGGELLI